MVRALGGDNRHALGSLFFITYGIAFVILLCFTFLGTRERCYPPDSRDSIKDDLHDLMENRPWVILALMDHHLYSFYRYPRHVTAHYFKYFVGFPTHLTSFYRGSAHLQFYRVGLDFQRDGNGLPRF